MLPAMHPNTQRVQTALDAAGSLAWVGELEETTHTAADAARALGCGVGAIASSLVFVADSQPVLVITSGAHHVDTRHVARQLGVTQLERASADVVRRVTGFPIGGVAPIATTKPMRTAIDRALAAHDVVWAAAGTPHTVFSTTYDELVRLTDGQPVDVQAA